LQVFMRPDFGANHGGVRLCAEGARARVLEWRHDLAQLALNRVPTRLRAVFAELAERLAVAGDDAEAATGLRKAFPEKHCIEVVGPPRQDTD
jgi:hypothetical protein